MEETLNVIENADNPTVLTFISEDTPITIPIWTMYKDEKFYIFASKTSNKVKSIENGSTKVALNIINNDYYPHPSTDILSYIGIKGIAKIITFNDNNDVADIHVDLLKKYDPNGEHDWISNLIAKIETKPKETWLIEITPTKWFSY